MKDTQGVSRRSFLETAGVATGTAMAATAPSRIRLSVP